MRPGWRDVELKVKTMKIRIASLGTALLIALLAPQTVAAVPVGDAACWPVSFQHAYCTWTAVPDAAGYAAFVNGMRVPFEASPSVPFIDVGRMEGLIGSLIGPADVVDIASFDEHGRSGQTVRPGYRSYGYVFIPSMTLQFGPNQSRLDAAALAKLESFAVLLRAHGFTRMIAVGHDPGPAGPYRLGRLRAEATTSALGDLLTISMASRSAGNQSPVASNATEAGRSDNRRVELGVG